jgi:CubicO group peptidase (beta-lactamase class C family)
MQETLQELLEKTVDHKKVFGAVLEIENGDGDYSFQGASGNLHFEDAFFIASTTKLYTTALVLKLVNEGEISLEDTLGNFFEPDLIAGLNVYHERDYSAIITVKQLLSHTSGIPDYFLGKPAGSQSLEKTLTEGADQGWTFEQVLERARSMRGAFPPGKKGKVLYADTNFQLLGRIIEIRRGKLIGQVFTEEIFQPLKLRSTYLFGNQPGQKPAVMYFRSQPLRVPLAMASFGPDGGIVSTALECMLFLKAFFCGFFFPKSYLNQMTAEFNRIFFPLEYGMGIMRFKLPRLLSPFTQIPELLGHSGLSGAFAFYCPEKELYLCGTVNQIANPGLSYQMLSKAVSLL